MAISAAARSSSLAAQLGSELGRYAAGAIGSGAVFSSRMSFETSRCTGPCGSASATRNARRTASWIFDAAGIEYAHLVIGRWNVTWSMSWLASFSRSQISCAPLMLMTGT